MEIWIDKLVLPVSQKPKGPGWNISTGNEKVNEWWRVCRVVGGQIEALLHTEHWKES